MPLISDTYHYEYDSEDNNYCYRGTYVLRNKFHTDSLEKLHILERHATDIKLAQLEANPVCGGFDLRHLCDIHRYLFQDVYTWAGQVRKGGFFCKGLTIFCDGADIVSVAKVTFDYLHCKDNLKYLSRYEFVQNVVYFMSAVNKLHPFREGNGRTQREFFRLLALNAGHILDWNKIAPDDLLAADVRAFNQDYAPLFGLLQTAVLC